MAGAGAVNAALASVGPVAKLVQWALRLLKHPAAVYVWPPSKTSAPFYGSGWAAIFLGIYFGFVRTGKSKWAEWEKKRKRDYVAASIKNLLDYEAERKKEAAEAEKKKEVEDASAAAAAGKNGDKAAEPKPGETKAEAELGKAGDGKKEETKKKEAPDAKRMLGLLLDDVENGSITKIGVSASASWYTEALQLLKERVEHELREAITETRIARGVCKAKDNDPATLAKSEEWKDGEKLMNKIKMVTEEVHRAFGKQLIDRELLLEAKGVMKTIEFQRSAAIKRIWDLFRPHARQWLTGTLILAVTEMSWGFLFGEMVSMTQLAYNIESPAKTMAHAARWSARLVVGFAFNWPLDQLGDTLVDSVQAKMQLGLRNAVIESLLSQDREYFDHHSSGVLQERLNKDTEDLARTIIQQPKNLISATARVISKSYFLYRCSPQLFWLGVSIPVPFCVCLNTLGWKLVRKNDRKIGKVNDQAAGSTAEILREINTVRQFGMEHEERKRYQIVASWREQLEFSMLTLKRLTFGTMWMAFVASRIVNTYSGINFVAKGSLDAANLVLCVYQFDGITWGVRQIVDLVPECARLMQPLTRIATLLNSVPKIEPHKENPSKMIAPPKFNGRIEFKCVDFTYPSERQKQVLFGLSFVVEPRTKVAFVGKAGCGKSTSVTLIQRFYNASKGSIMLDGLPLADYDVHHLRRNIGVVAQDNVLFSTSIYENIVYGMGQGHLPEPTMAAVQAACDAANVTEFVNTFPNGLHTFIGEKGVKLSGGQKQRLAIARAIIRTPTILLLDEATSALDSVNEKEVQKALDRMLMEHQGVAIVIAHRLTTIKNCNKIIVMDKGKKVEEGDHKALMAIDVVEDTETKVVSAGYYHKMWDTQMGEETFSDASLMSDDQLDGKLSFLSTELTRLTTEKSKRQAKEKDTFSTPMK